MTTVTTLASRSTVRVRYAETDRVAFSYEVYREGTPTLLATGSTSHAALDREGRPRRLPENLVRRLS